MKLQAAFTIVRDSACLLLGLGGTIHQEVTGHVQPYLLALYAGLLGIPGTVSLWQLARGTGGPPATAAPSQPSASPSSSQP